ncbi:LysR family transcriptional regulator [Amycolatopsis viridis]|uniref:Molybdate transport repressor ModE-like protein n=1 Tax=Amycolatopsis viridis TaxID=185678 RepID=A0ABX0SSW6_9PSEU|nr:LysR family transcriptional regulator [Amycolatopsis viridis]NIH79725.1 molybdate transport repressor ModE-like protein [Amycolatopsis viridis]
MTRLPDVESLRLLVLVGHHGSLTAAAQTAGISQPSASKRISTLERLLGIQLLDRSRRGSALTQSGLLVSGWAQRVLDELGVMMDGAEALRRERGAQLSLAASLTVAEYLLPTWIGELRRAVPDLHVGMQVLNSSRVHELARHGDIDLGFVESPGGLAGVRSRVVARDRLVLVVAPDHPWRRRRRPVDPAELAATALISRESGSGTRETAEQALRAAGAEPVEPLLELGSATAVRSAVAAGAGPALISELIVAPDLTAGTLVEIPTVGVDLGRALRAVWRSGTTPVGPAARLLTIALRRNRRTAPAPGR